MYMHKILIILSLLIISNLSADTEEAKELFDEAKCMKCHTKIGFNLENDRVKNFQTLSKSVNQCVYSTHTGWFEEEISDVVHYLNEEHYHYKK